MHGRCVRWWIGHGLSEALLDGSLKFTDEIKLILARINEQLKWIQDRSQAAQRRAPPDELIKRALLSLAYSGGSGPTVSEIRERFSLDEWTAKEDASGLPDVEALNSALIKFTSEAEIDLEQRGPGDFLGTRQSGYTKQLHMAKLTDLQLIEKAQKSAKKLFDQDPDLSLPEHRELAATLAHFWGKNGRPPQADIS